MAGSSRDGTVGSGYDYQWDVASYLLLIVAADLQDNDALVGQEFLRLGPCSAVHLEGSVPPDGVAQEDVTFIGSDDRVLHVQIKERTDPSSRWQPGDAGFVSFIERAARASTEARRRFLFLSNVDGSAKVRTLIAGAEALGRYRDEVVANRSADAASLPDAARFSQLTGVLELLPFYEARDVSVARPTGVGSALVRLLAQLGAVDPQPVSQALSATVKDWSIRAGGTRLLLPDLRRRIFDIVGLSPSGVSSIRVVDLVEDMKRNQTTNHIPGRITWSDLANDRIFIDHDLDLRARTLLDQNGTLFVVGARGAGKSVLVSHVVRHLYGEGISPALWDFDRFGHTLPSSADEYVGRWLAYGKLFGGRPTAIIENAHVAPRVLEELMMAARHYRDLRLIVTSRTHSLLAELGTDHQGRLQTSLLDLSADNGTRHGELIVQWYLTTIRQLDRPALHRAYAAVPWSAYAGDLLVLRLALEAFDSDRFQLSRWAIHDHLRNMIRAAAAGHPWAQPLLILAAALGRSGVGTDLRAAGRLLRMSIEEARAAARALAERGVLSVNNDECRFWHQSLAALYWEVLHIDRGRWPVETRQALGLLA
ncbi:MAG TPA: hypothetical protein VKZ18_09885 [Polyangia bacterium]|nr:hypothetical protein [Polyangia bacterium]